MKQPEPFGKFLLLGQVAVGGMAEIYKARFADPARQNIEIAIKRILPSYTEDEGFVTMFKDEGNIALRLNHPNIVKIYEVGEVNNDWYIAMEYIHGSDLRVLSDAAEKYNRRFTPTQVARIMCETSKALHYAHTSTDENGQPLNIVHRDCTPHNIMVTHSGGVKLMDFGIAKAASRATKTRVGTVKGKSSYMSPEQAKGRALDGRSDMFTLGTVIWEMLTGYRLFKANSDFDILTKVLKSEIIHPSKFGADVPMELGDIVMRTLERNRDNRYQDCGELARVLETWIAANGDGSDRQLGNMALALTNRQGHSYMEAPEFVRGPAEYKCVDGEFVPTNANAVNQYAANGMESAGPTEAMAAPSQFQMNNQGPATPQASFPQFPPVYPEPMMQPATTNKVPPMYIVAYAFMALLIIGCFIFAGYVSSSNDAEASAFTPPTAFISLKACVENTDCKLDSDNIEAAVSIDGTPVLASDGKQEFTPIRAYKSALGKNIKIKFEKEGYEPVTVDRPVVLSNQVIAVTMHPIENKAKGSLESFVINTNPEGLEVKVDGESKGKSPVTLENLKYGSQIEVEISDVNGYEPLKRTIDIDKDTESSVDLILAKAEAPGKKGGNAAPEPKKQQEKTVAKNTNDTKKNDKASAPKTPKQTTPKAAATGNGTGKISYKAKPWATVSIDSARAGTTPGTKDVKEGKHKIEFFLPSKGKKESKTITVKAGQTVTIGYDFDTNKWM